jgi:hypothetical protein
MLKKLSDTSVKILILALVGSRYPEYAQENVSEGFENLMFDGELIDLARP